MVEDLGVVVVVDLVTGDLVVVVVVVGSLEEEEVEGVVDFLIGVIIDFQMASKVVELAKNGEVP